jgi:hypothetical protein
MPTSISSAVPIALSTPPPMFRLRPNPLSGRAEQSIHDQHTAYGGRGWQHSKARGVDEATVSCLA